MAAARHAGLPAPRGVVGTAVTSEAVGHWAVHVRVSGEVDLSSARGLTEALRATLDTPDLLAVVLDLTQVRFLSAAGLTALVRTLERAAELAVELHLVAGHRPVLRPLEVTGLLPRFRLHASATAALARYASASSR